ncbi:hypothetical protein SAMN05661091_3552 [Paenibacillus uliginis N3/975]|uniref:Uncharacterized protein n=1 Tax=Paenibacillus uliginis N3/975 TaxID=1313296 RepID=A0A1X7HHS0_9BACL|nr:hypothetical protein [Paenibacillus uliginis]SMF86906.1 hypothetical protein SAMN05661091_3552 [Paenibacillus uliginis N3/975]
MELQTRSKEQEQPEIISLGKRIAHVMLLGVITVAGALAIMAVVLGILFFSGETSQFIYMNF